MGGVHLPIKTKKVTGLWPHYGFLHVNGSAEINPHTYMFPLKCVLYCTCTYAATKELQALILLHCTINERGIPTIIAMPTTIFVCL
jgi:hypothetical protein